MYADNGKIGGVDVNTSEDILAPMSQVQHATSLDYYAEEERIFWADVDTNQIVSIKRDSTNRTVVINEPNARIHSLAVDWIAGNLYWTNKLAGSDSSTGIIEVARLNGSHRYIVVQESKDFPRSIQIDPRQG